MPVGASSWSFTEDDAAAITESLRRFVAESNARCALLVDRAGQLVASAGEPPRFDPTAFATLTAADYSANDQLARLIGETEFSSLVHRGEPDSMLLADIARRIILVAIFDGRTTEGMVRRRAKATLDELARLFADVFGRAGRAQSAQPGVLAGADDEIDRLFQ